RATVVNELLPVASAVARHSIQTASFVIHNSPVTNETYALSLHDALPICQPGAEFRRPVEGGLDDGGRGLDCVRGAGLGWRLDPRSEEQTSELQSQSNLVCRILLGNKKSTRRADTSTALWPSDA